MKVALLFPPLYGVDFPPLGIAYIAGQARHDGHDVKMFSFNSRLYYQHPSKRFLWDWDKADLWKRQETIVPYFDIPQLIDAWTDEVLAWQPQVIGISVNSHSLVCADLLACRLKEKNPLAMIVFGGPYCSEYLFHGAGWNPAVSMYVRGEGEKIFSAVLAGLASGKVIDTIPGTCVATDHGFKDNGAAPHPAFPDDIPFPALDLFDWHEFKDTERIPILFSRGCDFHCRFCCDKPMWGRYRMRSARNIVDEMKQHRKLFNRNEFKCNDLMVNGDIAGLDELCDLLIAENMQVPWGSMARARTDMSAGLLRKMKQAGCLYLTFGIESGSNQVLRHMGKPLVREIRDTLANVSCSGIIVNVLFMVGYPIEQWRHFGQSIWFLLRYRRYIDTFVAVSICYIPALSRLHTAREELGIQFDRQNNWYLRRGRNTITIRQLRARLLTWCAYLLGVYKGGI